MTLTPSARAKKSQLKKKYMSEGMSEEDAKKKAMEYILDPNRKYCNKPTKQPVYHESPIPIPIPIPVIDTEIQIDTNVSNEIPIEIPIPIPKKKIDTSVEGLIETGYKIFSQSPSPKYFDVLGKLVMYLDSKTNKESNFSEEEFIKNVLGDIPDDDDKPDV